MARKKSSHATARAFSARASSARASSARASSRASKGKQAEAPAASKSLPQADRPLAKPFHSALLAELESKGADLPELRAIARKAIDQALDGEKEARSFIADRLDGKAPTAAQAIGHEEQVTVVIRRFAKDRTPL